VAKFLRGFECAWQSVRPVPRVEIDFGNGTKLTRTLNGNIATLFCTSDGGVYDIVPGLVAADEFLRRAREAVALHGFTGSTRTLAAYHRVKIDADGDAEAGATLLDEDTRINIETRYPMAHALMARRPLARPEEITSELYRDILDVDLDDPFLGLKPHFDGA